MTDKKQKREKRRLTATQFNSILPLLGHLSDKRINAARRSLVNNETFQSIADDSGWKNRASVGDAVNVVWEIWEIYLETQEAANSNEFIPDGWKRVTLVAPLSLISKFQDEIIEFIDRSRKGSDGKE